MEAATRHRIHSQIISFCTPSLSSGVEFNQGRFLYTPSFGAAIPSLPSSYHICTAVNPERENNQLKTFSQNTRTLHEHRS